ncbi:hypothetical protein [Saccharibacillus kuerlensis]|nr:hypothetical protein [Saccharibacillus kuerlensis]
MNIENQLAVHTREELRRWLQERGQTAQCCWTTGSEAALITSVREELL